MSPRPLVQTALSSCHAIGCGEVIGPGKLFCERHDRMLESDVRAVLARTYRPGKPPSKVFTVTLERALQEILYVQTAGHRIPKPGEFEW